METGPSRFHSSFSGPSLVLMNTKNMTIQIAHHPVSTRHDTGHGHIEVANTIEKDGREVGLDTKSNQFTGLYV